MISETSQAAILIGLSVVSGAAFNAPSLDQITIDGTTITAGGGGIAFLLFMRGVFKRLDDVLRMGRALANGWLAHQQRVENLHRVALKAHLQTGDGSGVPAEHMDPDASTPLEIDLHSLEESQRLDLPKTEYIATAPTKKPFIRRSTRRG